MATILFAALHVALHFISIKFFLFFKLISQMIPDFTVSVKFMELQIE